MSNDTGRRIGFAWSAAHRDRRTLPHRFVLRLQQTAGNQSVVRLLAPQGLTAAPTAALVETTGKPIQGPVAQPHWLVRMWRRIWSRPAADARS